jgi:hypothetical protein
VHFPQPDPVYERQYRLFLQLYEDLKASYRQAFVEV